MVKTVRSSRGPSKPAGTAPKRPSLPGHRSILSEGIKGKYILIVLILIATGIGVSTLFQSEEKRIKKQFRLLSEGISKESGESIFTMDQKIKKIGSLFDETCEVSLPAYSIAGRLNREEITGYAARARLHLSELHLTFYDFNITLTHENHARVYLTARLTGKMTTGETMNEAHEIDCLLKKIEKKWLFTKIELVEVLKK
jgi:hypothetical protein